MLSQIFRLNIPSDEQLFGGRCENGNFNTFGIWINNWYSKLKETKCNVEAELQYKHSFIPN